MDAEFTLPLNRGRPMEPVSVCPLIPGRELPRGSDVCLLRSLLYFCDPDESLTPRLCSVAVRSTSACCLGS